MKYRSTALIVSTLLLGSGAAQAASLPLLNATCPAGVSVHYDGQDTPYINGHKAHFTNQEANYWTIKQGNTFVDIVRQNGKFTVSMSGGPHGASGECNVKVANSDRYAQDDDNNRDLLASDRDEGQENGTAARAGQGDFDASGKVSCTVGDGGEQWCGFKVARGGNGNATIKIRKPDGRSRVIFFDNGKATSADLSQADGDMTFKARKQGDTYLIRAGREHYEIPEAAIYGD